MTAHWHTPYKKWYCQLYLTRHIEPVKHADWEKKKKCQELLWRFAVVVAGFLRTISGKRARNLPNSIKTARPYYHCCYFNTAESESALVASLKAKPSLIASWSKWQLERLPNPPRNYIWTRLNCFPHCVAVCTAVNKCQMEVAICRKVWVRPCLLSADLDRVLWNCSQLLRNK